MEYLCEVFSARRERTTGFVVWLVMIACRKEVCLGRGCTLRSFIFFSIIMLEAVDVLVVCLIYSGGGKEGGKVRVVCPLERGEGGEAVVVLPMLDVCQKT